MGENRGEIYALPASVGQERLWLLNELAPGNPSLNMQLALRLTGRLEVGVLRKSLAEVVRRHEILRTTFSTIDDKVVQMIHPSFVVDCEITDLRYLPESERDSRERQWLREDARDPFDISRLHLVRSKLLQLREDLHVLVMSMPQIICDEWSQRILEGELVALYEAYAEGGSSPLPEPAVQFSDFAQWQSQWLKIAHFEDDLLYWRGQLEGKLPLLDLPVDRIARSGMVARAETETLSISKGFVIKLKEFCKREQATLFMLLLAAFNTILYRYTGQDDILVGSPVAGRPPDTEGILGPFSYPICLRTSLSGEPTFREVIRRIARVTMEALIHKEVPLARVTDELEIKQVQGRNPLFQFYFQHEHAIAESRRTRDLVWSPLTSISAGTAFDLHLATIERDGELEARLEYNPEMFKAATIRRMLAQFRGVLEAVVVNPDMRISELPMQTPAELLMAGCAWAKEAEQPAGSASIVDAFEEQVIFTPDAVAVAVDNQELTYRELNGRADALAEALIDAGVEPGRVVGVCSEDSGDLLVGMLAVMKAGATYVWLSSVEAVRESAIELFRRSLKTVVVDECEEKWFLQRGIRTLLVGQSGARRRFPPAARVARHHGLVASASMRLAAGPAGEPVALVITNAALLVRVRASASVCGLERGDRVGLVASCNVEEGIWASLISGATVVFVPAKRQSSGLECRRFISERQCNVIFLDPSKRMQSIIPRDEHESAFPENVRLVVFQGEPLPSRRLQAVERLSGGCSTGISSYGRPETGTMAALSAPVRALDRDVSGGGVILDYAAPGYGIRILDRHLQRVPAGVYGEICVSGPGVCEGYFDQPQLTAARFVADLRDGTRLFRTGDLGRWLPDGRIEFLGSSERHLNVEGFRLHLGALEYALTCHPSVMEAVAVPSDAAFQDQRPNVYVVTDPKANKSLTAQRKADLRRELRAIASGQTPEYPEIARIVFSSALKRDVNGRFDLSALEPVDFADQRATPPRDELESELVRIWEEIFAVRPIGIRDNFFELRGHWILAVRLFEKIRTVFKQNLPLSTLIQAPTVEGLARIIGGDDGPGKFNSLVPVRQSGQRSPLYIISGLGGNITRFHDLAKLLHPDQPVYALQPPGLNGSRPYLTRIEDMAVHYVREIKEIQPRGPYFLVGYSFGGLVTFEMGRILLAQGDDVGLLALLDPPEWLYLWLARRAMRGRHGRRAYREPIQKHRYLDRSGSNICEASGGAIQNCMSRLFTALGRSLPQKLSTVEEINSFAAAHYVPQHYNGRITLFRTINDFNRNFENELGWRSLAAGGVEVHEIPGNRHDIMAEPNVRALADKLEQCFSHAQLPVKGVFETERIHVEQRVGIETEKPTHSSVVAHPSQMRALNG